MSVRPTTKARRVKASLLPIEVEATIGRKTRDARYGRSAARWVRDFRGHRWQPLSDYVADVAERFAATLFLRRAVPRRLGSGRKRRWRGSRNSPPLSENSFSV